MFSAACPMAFFFEAQQRSRAMEYETLLTPATCAASDDGKVAPPEGARNRRKWRGGLTRKHSSSPKLSSGGNGPTSKVKDVADREKQEKRPSGSNVMKRAMHKISKKTRRHSTTSSSKPLPSATAAVADTAPPKVEELGIDPRLLEKWMARKELKKQGEEAGEKPANSRGAATLVVVGLSSGSVAWAKERIRNLYQTNGVVLAACIVAVAVAIACALVVGRCS